MLNIVVCCNKSKKGRYMILDYENNQILITEEHGETFIKIQESCEFNLCVRLRNKQFQLPYIALPILKKTLKTIGYPIKLTDALKRHHRKFIAHREFLTSLKESRYDINNPEIAEIIAYIKKTEDEIRRRCKDFKGFYGNQIDTIIYGIIGKRIVIGNDIGTGKTLTSIMIAKFLMEKRNAGRTLILLPASLATNFYQDYNKYFHDKEMLIIGGEAKKKRESLYQTFKTTPRLKFLNTNYDKCNFDYEYLKDFKFDILIVDEFHKMKNFREAKRSANFFRMVRENWKPTYRFPMSGTPIENRIFDIYPVFKLLDDGMILGGERFFDSNFVEYVESTFRVYLSPQRYKLITKITPVGFKHHTFVKKLIAPYVIKKKLDLPAGLYKYDIRIEPSKEFMAKYEEVKKCSVNASARYAAVRQFLCDTERYGYKNNPKFDELENILSQTDSKVVIFSFFKCSIRAVSTWLKEHGYGCITCMGGDGTDALDVVNEFKKDPNLRCLVTTDKINFGHNIQEAKIIVEWEKPIKITTSMQRFGRCYRSGQTNDVHAYSFIVNNTVEEIIYEQLQLKKDVIEKIIDGLSTGTSTNELESMLMQIETAVLEKFMKS